MSDDECAIRDLIATWLAASQDGNLDRVLSLMSDETMRRSGYTLSILRKEQSGRWVLLRDANLLTKEDGREMMPS